MKFVCGSIKRRFLVHLRGYLHNSLFKWTQTYVLFFLRLCCLCQWKYSSFAQLGLSLYSYLLLQYIVEYLKIVKLLQIVYPRYDWIGCLVVKWRSRKYQFNSVWNWISKFHYIYALRVFALRIVFVTLTVIFHFISCIISRCFRLFAAVPCNLYKMLGYQENERSSCRSRGSTGKQFFLNCWLALQITYKRIILFKLKIRWCFIIKPEL